MSFLKRPPVVLAIVVVVLLGVAYVVAARGIGAPAPEAAPGTSGPVLAAPGETITVPRPDGVVAYTVREVRRFTPSSDPGGDRRVLLAVDLEVVVTKGSHFATSVDLAVEARDGTVYSWPGGVRQWQAGINTIEVAGHPDGFGSAELRAGQRRSGWVWFDLPPTAVPDDFSGGVIGVRIRVDGSGGAYGYWTA